MKSNTLSSRHAPNHGNQGTWHFQNQILNGYSDPSLPLGISEKALLRVSVSCWWVFFL